MSLCQHLMNVLCCQLVKFAPECSFMSNGGDYMVIMQFMIGNVILILAQGCNVQTRS